MIEKLISPRPLPFKQIALKIIEALDRRTIFSEDFEEYEPIISEIIKQTLQDHFFVANEEIKNG